MLKKRQSILVLAVVLAILVTTLIGYNFGKKFYTTKPFDGQRAYEDVIYQVNLGPRIPGSDAHNAIADYVARELSPYDWEITIQETTYLGKPVRNIIATRGKGQPWVLIGAHYDSRMAATNDPLPENLMLPVPAANDGASGVSVLLELGRTLPQSQDKKITLLFIDSEDQGNIPGWDWILGSKAYAEALTELPDAVVIVDMIGDSDLNIYQEANSDKELTTQIWDIAAELGYSQQFIAMNKYRILDDHLPFIEKGIPAVDIIDFDYPYWHTTSDTVDKVSPISLEIVGKTLYVWIIRY